MRINRSLITNFDQLLEVGNLEFTEESISSNTSLTDISGLKTKLVNAESGNITITLPTAVNNNASFIIKKIDSSTNTIIVDGYSSETIDGESSITIYDQYNYIEVISDGTNWKVINEYINLKW